LNYGYLVRFNAPVLSPASGSTLLHCIIIS
jgi:hypothetical protein